MEPALTSLGNELHRPDVAVSGCTLFLSLNPLIDFPGSAAPIDSRGQLWL
jgi:hypothetical protein